MALIFGAGAGVTHALEKTPYFPVHVSISAPNTHCTTAEEHEKEAKRLLLESLTTGDVEIQHQLQAEAYEHYRTADILEHGPYKV